MSQNDVSSTAGPDRPDANALPLQVYHRTVGPALQVAAETAAKRGHRQLFDDMPAMLALIEIVARLAESYRAHYPEAPAGHDALLDGAPGAACVMVFQEAKLDPATIEPMLEALERAHQQVHEHDVIGGSERYIAMAFSHLDDDERTPARHCLTQAAEHIIAAIELWRGDVEAH